MVEIEGDAFPLIEEASSSEGRKKILQNPLVVCATAEKFQISSV